jgi:hypothetical protein
MSCFSRGVFPLWVSRPAFLSIPVRFSPNHLPFLDVLRQSVMLSTHSGPLSCMHPEALNLRSGFHFALLRIFFLFSFPFLLFFFQAILSQHRHQLCLVPPSMRIQKCDCYHYMNKMSFLLQLSFHENTQYLPPETSRTRLGILEIFRCMFDIGYIAQPRSHNA